MIKLRLGTVLAAAAVIGLLGGCSAPTAQASSSKTSYQKVTQGNLTLGLSADGRIKLPVTNLNFSVNGTIKNIYAAAGDIVKKGDVLAELDDTDLQLALSNARIALEKAETAYEDAITSADYSLKTELASYETNKKKLETPFDDYTYQLSITNAQTSLERRKKDLADALETLAEAEAAMNTPVDENKETQAIVSARTTLERRLAELAEAEAALKEAQDTVIEEFDAYTYQNSVNTAKTTMDRRDTEQNVAYGNYRDAKLELDDANNRVGITAAELTSMSNNVQELEKKYESAKQVFDDAKTAYNTAVNNLERAKTAYYEDEADKKQTAVEAAEKKVVTARQSVEDAETSLANAEKGVTTTYNDAKKKVETAKQGLEDAESSLKNAYESLERAKKSYENDMETSRNNLVLQELKLENMINSTASIANARYAVEDAKVKLSTAENDLAQARVVAPIDGKILSVNKKEGEVVTASSSAPTINFGTQSGSGFMTICDLTQIYLTASITEGDIVGLSVGQKIRVAVDALGEEYLSGTVYSISSIPSTDASGIVTYEVIGVLDSLNDDVRDNMSAFLTFIKKERTNVLLIPNKAVFIEDGRQYVNVQLENGTIEKRAITGGLSNGTQTEVTEGLELGETVVVGSVKA